MPGIPLNQAVVDTRFGTCARRAMNAATFSAPLRGLRAAGNEASAVGDQHHFGGEQFHQPLHVARGDGGHELLDSCQLLRSIHLHPWPPRRDVLVGSVCDLADRGRALAHHFCDLLVRRLEHLAEHEHGTLSRTQGLEHGEHGYRDILGKLSVLRHIGAGEQRLGQPLPDVVLPPARH